MPLGKLKVETLRAICKELGIPYAKLRREEILELLLDVEKTGCKCAVQSIIQASKKFRVYVIQWTLCSKPEGIRERRTKAMKRSSNKAQAPRLE